MSCFPLSRHCLAFACLSNDSSIMFRDNTYMLVLNTSLVDAACDFADSGIEELGCEWLCPRV